MKIQLDWLNELLNTNLKPETYEKDLTDLGLKAESINENFIEIAIPPNRGDCLGIYGIARELAALYQIELKVLDYNVKTKIQKVHNIDVQAYDRCPKYLIRCFSNVNVQALTPQWIINRLNTAGFKNTSIVIDIINYVMLELGQPLHAFDHDKISGDLCVRLAKEKESLDLLGNQNIKLYSHDLVIADQKAPLALAGIKGGVHSAIRSDTTEILLECAWFEPMGIRISSKKHRIQTDTSYRFERQIDSNIQEQALERVSQLLVEFASAVPGKIVMHYNALYLPKSKKIILSWKDLKQKIGIHLEKKDIISRLKYLGIIFKDHGTEAEVITPIFRPDIELKEDLFEEIARHFGYVQIPEASLKVPVLGKAKWGNKDHVTSCVIERTLTTLGYHEQINYSFISKDKANICFANEKYYSIINPISLELAVMRPYLWPSLLNNIAYNVYRQQKRLKFFEIGRSYKKQLNKEIKYLSGVAYGSRYPKQWALNNHEKIDFYDIKQDIINLAKALNIKILEFKNSEYLFLHTGQSADIYLNSKKIGFLGRIHPTTAKQFDVPLETYIFEIQFDVFSKSYLPKFVEISKFPQIRRDISILVEKYIPAKQLLDLIFKETSSILKNVEIVDLYEDNNIKSTMKSITFSLVFQSEVRTLRESEVVHSVDGIIKMLERKINAKLRE